MSIPFKYYRYIFPPRAENITPRDTIEIYEDRFVGQPKLNGSNMVIFTNGTEVHIKNRHNKDMSNVKMPKEEFLKLHRGTGWMILVGEYLNKSKKDHTKNFFNHKFIIFDIIAINDEQLIGKSFEERIQLLDELYGTSDSSQPFLHGINDYTYRVKSFNTGFQKLFDELTLIDMYEGFVFKMKKATLENGVRSSNNTRGQIKCRKPTKNYSY